MFKPFESPYMNSYLTSMDTISLSLTVFEIFDFKIFRVWPWPLTLKGHLRSKKICTVRKPIYDFLFDFYGHHLSIFYRFRDIRLQNFRVWPRPLTPKGHLGSKMFIPFESPYKNTYLTSMDTISLSLTVLEIFDFKMFRVWPWPLTLKGHLWSKKIFPFESPYVTSYLTSMDTISLSFTVFETFDLKNFRVWPWPLTPNGHLGSKNLYTVRKPIYESLFDFYGHHISISYRFRDIRLQNF